MKQHDLIVLSVATSEISDNSIEKFVNSMNFHNYNFKILGRHLKWSGFQSKTKICIDEIENIKNLYKYTVICDCTDVFVTAPPQTLIDILNFDPKIYIGAEHIPYYNKGKNTYQKIISFLQSINSNTSFSPYPNGGFLCGPTLDLLKIIEKNLEYIDDQAGYMDAIFNGTNICIDYNNIIVSNIPNYNYFPYSLNNLTRTIINQYKHDKILNRFYNTTTLQYPIFLHFPGKNFSVMNNFYNVITHQEPCIDYDIKTDNKSIFISVFIVISIFILLYITYISYYYLNFNM